jgi:hypothetical protein
MEVDRHFRVRTQELGQDRRHMGETERHRSGEAHRPARRTGLRDRMSFGRLALVQYARRMREQVSADLA